jgi:hypothetical protein
VECADDEELGARGLDCHLVVERRGFNGPDPVGAPVGGANFLDEDSFDAVGQLEPAVVILQEEFEICGGFAGDQQTVSQQTVLQSVSRRTLFSFGTRGFVGLGAIGA